MKDTKNPFIAIIVGEIASGKTTYANMSASKGFMIIELGDIVREITHKAERTFSNDFDDAIYEAVRDTIGENIDQYNKFIIVGPRSPELMDRLVKLSKNPSIIYLNVPEEKRRRRFYKSNREKDKNITFEEACKKDNSIGLDILIKRIEEGLYGPYIKITDTNEPI